MTPQNVHRICQEIRHLRELLTAENKWTLSQPFSDTRKDCLDRIEFWREILNGAERKIASGEVRASRPLRSIG
jgi:hypothetical protein